MYTPPILPYVRKNVKLGHMFTGIIIGTGRVTQKTENSLVFTIPPGVSLEIGDSIAVNGVCLTAVKLLGAEVHTNILAETWRRSNLGNLSEGSLVNLERPAKIGGTLDGHIVQGHVDGVGHITSITEGPLGHIVEITPPAELLKYMVEKGSVTVDGMSLTITRLTEHTFTFEAIPHTWAITNLHTRAPKDAVNIEVDVIAKYVERLMGHK